MSKQLVLILTEPTEGQEDEYNDFYENQHIDDVLRTSMLETGQRFKLVAQAGEECPLSYLALYEVEAESGAEVLANLNASRPEREMSNALNLRTGRVWVFEEAGPKHHEATGD